MIKVRGLKFNPIVLDNLDTSSNSLTRKRWSDSCKAGYSWLCVNRVHLEPTSSERLLFLEPKIIRCSFMIKLYGLALLFQCSTLTEHLFLLRTKRIKQSKLYTITRLQTLNKRTFIFGFLTWASYVVSSSFPRRPGNWFKLVVWAWNWSHKCC